VSKTGVSLELAERLRVRDDLLRDDDVSSIKEDRRLLSGDDRKFDSKLCSRDDLREFVMSLKLPLTLSSFKVDLSSSALVMFSSSL